METDKNRQYYTVEEVATSFGVNESTVRSWANEGALKAIKVGKKWFFPIKETDELVNFNPLKGGE